MTTKLEQAAREVIRQHSMECLTDKAITALREALAEQAEQEPVMITPGGGAFPFAVVGEMEQAEQEPVAIDWEPLQNFWRNNSSIDWGELESAVKCAIAAPVRTKDLTDDEIMDLVRDECVDMRWPSTPLFIARAVIAADREKNK